MKLDIQINSMKSSLKVSNEEWRTYTLRLAIANGPHIFTSYILHYKMETIQS